MTTFVVEFWCRIFKGLSCISPFRVLQAVLGMEKWQKKTASGVVDLWVMANGVMAALALALSYPQGRRWWEWVLVAYGITRIFETVVYQINVLFFDPYGAKHRGRPYAREGYRRTVLLAIHNYAEILCWFALCYRNFPSLFNVPDNLNMNSFSCSFYYSLTTMSTLGYGDITPRFDQALLFVVPQTLIGIFMTVLILASFLDLLPKPGTNDDREKARAKR